MSYGLFTNEHEARKCLGKLLEECNELRGEILKLEAENRELREGLNILKLQKEARISEARVIDIFENQKI